MRASGWLATEWTVELTFAVGSEACPVFPAGEPGGFTVDACFTTAVKSPSMVNEAAIDRVSQQLDAFLPEGWRVRVRSAAGPYDAELVLRDPSGRSTRLLVETKSRLEPAQAMSQLSRYAAAVASVVVVAPVVSTRAREVLEKAGVNWIELDGDFWIATDGIAIARSGSPRRRQKAKKRLVANIFSGYALRIVRTLLVDSERTWSVSEMSAAAGASIGFVSRVFATLVRDAYAIRTDSRLRLTRADELLDAWTAAPSPEEERAEGVSLEAQSELLNSLTTANAPGMYAVTGEAAAELVAPFARVTRVELYARDLDAWRRYLRLTPVPVGGNVILIRSADKGIFEGTREVNGVRIVSLPQLYVDLMRRQRGGPEAAAFLRQRTDILKRQLPASVRRES